MSRRAGYVQGTGGGDLKVIRVSSLYETCSKIFADHPLAIGNCDDDTRSMILMLREGDDARFFVLSHEYGDATPLFLLRPWRAGEVARIEADSGGALSDVLVSAVTRGIPIPRHGSLFGWKAGDAVTAMIAVDAEYTPVSPQPSWAVMPLADSPEAQWPPFTGEPFFGQWFWEYHQVGSIVSLDDLIAAVPATVFWVDTEAILGWDTCAVAHNIKSSEGYTLRRGRYAYYRVLRMRKQVPSLGTLLANDCKTDLAPRFKPCVRSDG